MRKFVVLLPILLGMVISCSSHSSSIEASFMVPNRAMRYGLTQGDISYSSLGALFLGSNAQIKRKVEDTLDNTLSDLHRLVPVGTVGTPPGWTVVVLQSGSFPIGDSFAMGAALLDERIIYLALRRCSGENLSVNVLPAYRHELVHAWLTEVGAPLSEHECLDRRCRIDGKIQSYSEGI